MTISDEVALLAPVPVEHLKSGLEVCKELGQVAFGSMDWKLFQELDRERDSLKVRTYVYASLEDTPGRPRVTWKGLYVRHVDNPGGKDATIEKFRPPSTRSDTGDWAVFWFLESLEEISEDSGKLLISQLAGRNSKRKFSSTFVPRRPMLILCP